MLPGSATRIDVKTGGGRIVQQGVTLSNQQQERRSLSGTLALPPRARCCRFRPPAETSCSRNRASDADVGGEVGVANRGVQGCDFRLDGALESDSWASTRWLRDSKT